jgi:TP901 family phage tail tape measure protein
MADEVVRASLEFDVNQAVRQTNQLTTAIAKIESSTAKGVGALSRIEKQSVQAAQATRRLAGEYKNLAAELGRVNKENARLLSAQPTQAASPALSLGNKRSNLMPVAQKISQNAAYSTYTSNIAVAQAARESQRLIDQQNNSLSNQRYALYDVARTWTVVSAAILGTAGAVTKLSIDYQRNFANVARTTGVVGQAAQDLKRDLVDLTTAIPENFAQITEIAALGGQLNIAASGIEDFTSVTARLTATTNLTAEAAGTALGRFQALLNVPSSEFENLASSILKVGVNSVATETQIVGIATQISSMGDLAGFTADQVIGMSGALASVGGQPELSRGTITRTFSLMSAAVAEGGDKLEKFAAVAGVSAQEFANSWGTDRFAQIFQNFLANLGTDGNAAISVLRDLGITSVRDVPLLLRLAGATDVVSAAFSDAETGYRDATELNKQYGVVAETVAAKLTVLGNTIKAIAESIGGEAMGPFGDLLDVVQNIANALLFLSRSPVAQFFLGTAGAVAVLAGALMGYRALQALTLASMYAMKTAHLELGAAATTNSGALRGLTGMMAANAIGLQRATAAQTAYNLSISQGNGKFASFIAGTKAATVATNGLATAGKAATKAFVWTAVLSIGIGLLSDFFNKSQEAAASVDALTASLDQNTGALTENSREQIYNDLIKGDIAETARSLGINLRTVTDAAMGDTAATRELTGEYETLLARITELNQISSRGGGLNSDQYEEWKSTSEAADGYATILSAVGIGTERVSQAQGEWRDAAEAGAVAAQGATESLEDMTSALQDNVDLAFEAINADLAMQNALYGLGQSLAENGTSFDVFSAGGRANMESLQKTISAMVSASAGNSATLAALLAGLMQQLAGYGVDAVNELAFVQAMIAQLAGKEGLVGVEDAAARAGSGLSQGFAVGAAKAAKSAGRASKEVKTLTDYVNDLEGVFSSAFDFRFGLGNSLDDVADAWQALRENSDEAAEGVRDALQAIREADAEIRGLNAAQTTLEYQLRVAQEYGDVLRTNEILAEMAENQAKLGEAENDRTDAQKDLTKAQNGMAKSLSGGTEASREQRDLVESLLKSYAAQVSALANTGLSQADLTRKTAELRAEFVRQMTQLGYNSTEVEGYARAFDDLTYAIERVPRNITVSANTDPAVRAVEEFLAKVRSSSANVSVGANGDGYNAGYEAGKAYGQGWSAGQGLTRKLKVIQDSGVTGGIKYTYDGVNFFLNKGGYVNPSYLASGGVPGMHPGGPKGSDTVPAWLTPKEYVMNPQSTSYYGLPFMNALNNMQVPRYLASGGPVGGSSSRGSAVQLVELLPNQIRQLADALYVRIELDGKELASSVNKTNYGSATRGNN